MHSTVRGADLILSASYSTKPELSQARKIYKGPEIGVDFECGYSMADQVIDENYAVTGEKLVASRRHQVSALQGYYFEFGTWITHQMCSLFSPCSI